MGLGMGIALLPCPPGGCGEGELSCMRPQGQPSPGGAVVGVASVPFPRRDRPQRGCQHSSLHGEEHSVMSHSVWFRERVRDLGASAPG